MRTQSFPPEVAEKVEFYVYRLIDPRNGETFYVGKGHDNRVFDHVNGVLKLTSEEEEDALDIKMQRIKEIRSAGLEVGHVIHRHGIKDGETAYQIEAAVIDAYPGLTNKVGGHSNDFGVAHVDEIVALYAAEPFVRKHPLLLISIGHTYREKEKTVLDAVRYAWVLDERKAQKAEFVLAHVRGLVKGAFKPTKWMKATPKNFPGFKTIDPERWGFEGVEADGAVRSQYVGKRVPDRYRAKGAANPVRYMLDPSPIS